MSENLGYSPKELKFGQEGREKLLKGTEKLSKAVKSTLGFNGNTVLIESPNHLKGITVTKDGWTVAKDLDLIDPIENLAVRILKEAAKNTVSQAGDGSTTSIVLAEALVQKGFELINDGINRTEVLRHLSKMTDIIIEKLQAKSKEVTDDMLLDVAVISVNNDKAIGEIIANAYKSIGKGGRVTVGMASNSETTSKTTQGVVIERGYTSPLFINDQELDICLLDDVMVLVSDIEINNIMQVQFVLEDIIKGGKKLLIIAPCSTNFTNTLAMNVVKNSLKLCAIQPPNFGYKQHELMQDIAVTVGATYFSEKTGDDLSHIKYEDLGHATSVIVAKDKTTLIKSFVKSSQEEIDERVSQLRSAHKKETNKNNKEFILERIASLTGGIGLISVGGNTELEQKELYDRVDDAVCAVRSALEEGILPGAGKALAEINLLDTIDLTTCSEEEQVAYEIMNFALYSPLKQILENAGLDFKNYYNEAVKDGFGLNLKTREFGDLIEMGVIDPLKVTRCALQNAVSVAITILSTNAIITMARTYEAQ